MLKFYNSLKEQEIQDRAVKALTALLIKVPGISIKAIKTDPHQTPMQYDILANVEVGSRPHVLVCEVKTNGQPRFVRAALLELGNLISKQEAPATPILIAPYLSSEAQDLCREEEVGFLDLEGNARIVFEGVFIERQVASKPRAERRDLKSIFKPKSAQVLRALLHKPGHAWRVTELAKEAAVSVGHISNVRTALLDREWAKVSSHGLTLSDPDALLDAWRDTYEPPAGRRLSFYTTLHGSSFEDAARKALGASLSLGQAVFASFSAARWLAPYGRVGTQLFYADEAGLKRLQSALDLSSAAKGENVLITVPKDQGIFRDTAEPAPGVICTGPIQTYLDLTAAGERGREAAEHLRKEKLKWSP
jgi:hypothetical protein